MKSVLISIQPKWCELIAAGDKTLEVRKNKPKLQIPFKCYIYRTKGHVKHIVNGKWFKMHVGGSVIGEFVCNDISVIECSSDAYSYWNKQSCMTMDDFIAYCDGQELYGWHISNLKIYEKPKKLSEFLKPCICPEMPYCPSCSVGYEYISETEAEFYRVDGECNTEWICMNHLKRPPQSWCYVEELQSMKAR